MPNRAALFAGSRTESGYVDDIGDAARFEYPACFVVDDDYLYVTEYGGDRVRRIDPVTAEVTTAATLTPGATPFGICRADNGNFYVACPGDQTVKVYTPTWVLFKELPTNPHPPTHDYRVWYVAVNGGQMFTTGHNRTGDTFSSFVQLWNATLTSDPTNIDIDLGLHAANGHVAFSDPGGIEFDPTTSYVYFSVARFGNRSIYRVGSALATTPDVVARLVALPAATAGESIRQLHFDPDNRDVLYLAFGPSDYNGPVAPGYGNGSRKLTISTLTWEDPAPPRGSIGGHASNLSGTQRALNIETDYLPAFGRQFVCSSRISMSGGFEMFTLHGHGTPTDPGPHCIEVYVKPRGKVHIYD